MAFLMMATTSYRHRMLYVMLARPFRVAGMRSFAGALVTLGTFKFVYEGIWLLSCALPLLATNHAFGRVPRTIEDGAVYLAIGAFLGCIGYGIVWIVMITLHARAITQSSRRGPSGFDVITP